MRAARHARNLVLALLALIGADCFLAYPVTPLAAAARSGDLKEIDRLAASGANLDEGSGVNGWPPVLHAVHKGQAAALAHLIELGASIQGSTGQRAMVMARQSGSQAMIDVLRVHGVESRGTN